MNKLKTAVLTLLMLILSVSADTVIIDPTPNEIDGDIWNDGSADVFSLYLEKAGIKVISRNHLKSTIKEFALSDSGFTETPILKGNWLGSEYILNGSLVKNDSNLLLKLKLTKTSSGQLIKSFDRTFSSEKEFLNGLKEAAFVFAKTVNENTETKTITLKDENYLFRELNADVLFHYYKAINLIQTGKEAEGMTKIVALMKNSPTFELPYYWFISFCEKHNFAILSKALYKVISIEALKELNQKDERSKSVIFIRGDAVTNNDAETFLKYLKKKGFTVVEPGSLKALANEQTLKKWKFSRQDSEIASLINYRTSYSFYLKKGPVGFELHCKDSNRGKTLLYKKSANINLLFTDINEMIDSSIKEKNIEVTNSGAKAVAIKEKYDSEDGDIPYLFANVINGGDAKRLIYRLFVQNSYRKDYLNNPAWRQIIELAEKDKDLWLNTYLTRKYGLNWNLSKPQYSCEDVENYFKFIKQDPKILKNPLLLYSLKFNKACLLIHKSKYKEANAILDLLLKSLPTVKFDKQSSDDLIRPSLNYWKWYCAYKLKSKKDLDYWTPVIKEYIKNVQRPFLAHFISPTLYYSATNAKLLNDDKFHYYYQDLKQSMSCQRYDRMELWYKLIENKPKFEWPKLPLYVVKDILPECQETVNKFHVWIRQNSQGVLEKQGEHKVVNLFLKAVSHLLSNPNYTLSVKEAEEILYLVKYLRPYEAVDLLLMFGKIDEARTYIKKSQIRFSTKQYLSLSLEGRVLNKDGYKAFIQNLIKNKDLLEKYAKNVIEKAIRRNMPELTEELIAYFRNKKDLSSYLLSDLDYYEAELFFMKGDFITAQKKFEALKHKKTSGLFNIKDINNKITYLQMAGHIEFTPTRWDSDNKAEANDHFYNGTPRKALNTLKPEVKKDFLEIYKKLYFQRSVNTAFIIKDIRSFIKKHPQNLASQMIQVLDNGPTFREKAIAQIVLENVSISENADILLKAFKRDRKFMPYAMKASKKEAVKILQERGWIIGGSSFIKPTDMHEIISNRITELYPIVFSYCMNTGTNYWSYLSQLRLSIEPGSPRHLKENFRLCIRKALAETKRKINDPYFANYIPKIANIAFISGEIDGMRSLLSFTKLPAKHRAYFLSTDVISLFNESVEGVRASSIAEIQQYLYKLNWVSEKLIWTLAEDQINKIDLDKIKQADKTLTDESGVFSLSQYSLEASSIKSAEFDYSKKFSLNVKLNNNSIEWSKSKKYGGYWYMRDGWSVNTLGQKTIDQFTPNQQILTFRQKNNGSKTYFNDVFGLGKGSLFLLWNFRQENTLYLVYVEQSSEGFLKLKYKLYKIRKK